MKLFITLSLLALGVCLSSAKPSPALDADPEAEGFLISIFRSISTRVATQTFRKGQDLRGKFDESEEESVGKIWSDCGKDLQCTVYSGHGHIAYCNINKLYVYTTIDPIDYVVYRIYGTTKS